MKVSQLLIDAKELIKDPEHWTKGEYARDSEGKKVADSHSEACQWCIVGALWRASGLGPNCYDSYKASLVNDGCKFLIKAVNSEKSLSKWNDSESTTHDDVMKAYNKAIELSCGDC